MSRPLRIAGYILTGVLAGLLVAAMAIWLITRTEWGMERARRFAVSWLAEQVNGTLHIGRISGRGLLGGMVIHDFGITDPRGRPFLRSDSLELAYDWKTLVAGRIDLSRVVLYQPEAVLEILPGDTLWNYQIVFTDSVTGAPPARRQLVRFADARIINGSATVRLGLHPHEPIAPADTARAILEAVPGGLARTMRFEQINADFDRVLWESPLEAGRMFEIERVSARGYVWREPFIVQNARGTLTLLDTIVSFDMPEVSLPNSRASVVGQVIRTAGHNKLDVRVDGERLQLSDLQFIHPQLPNQGSGRVRLTIKSQDDGVLWLAEDAQLNTEGTRLAGTVGVVMGDTMYFTRVNLRASPLDVRLLERLIPGGLPVEGLLVGTVEVRGPISALQTSGDLQLDERGTGSHAHVAWRGVVDARDGVRARSMHADVKRLELALLSAFNPRVQLGGSLSGNVNGSGTLQQLSFTGLLEHVTHDGGRVTFDGGGTVSGRGRSRQLDVALSTSSVTLQDLAKQVPALQGLQGDVTGPVRVRGTADDLSFEAQLVTPGGLIGVVGRVRGESRARRISALASATQFRLHALRTGLPETVGSGRLHVDFVGEDLASATGTVRLELDSARLYDLPNARITVDGTLERGLLNVDSARWRTTFGTATATGTLGLLEEREGSLDVHFRSESLAPLERYFFGAESVAEDGDPRLAGTVEGSAAVKGWVGALRIAADARAQGLIYGSIEAARLQTEMEIALGNGQRAPFTLRATADSLALWSHPLRTARLDAAGTRDSIVATLRGANGAQEVLAARGMARIDSAQTLLQLEHLRVGGTSPWLLNTPATITLADGRARAEHVELLRSAGGRALARGQLAWTSVDGARALPLDFTLDLDGVPFTEMLRALRSRESGAGDIAARLHVHGTATDPTVEAHVDARNIRYGDVRLDRAYAELTYFAQNVDAHAEAHYGGRTILTGSGRVPLDLRFAGVGERRLAEPLRLSVIASGLPPALPLALLDGFSATAGSIDGTVTFGGTTREPALSGGLRITDGAALWDVSGVRYHAVNGDVILEDDRIVRLDLTARAGDVRNDVLRSLTVAAAEQGGGGTVRGTVDLREPRDARFDLQLTAERVWAARRRDVEAIVSGAVRLQGRYRRPELSGSLRVEQGAMYLEEVYRQYLIGGIALEDPGLISLVDTTLVAVRPLLSASKNPFLRGLRVSNLGVQIGADSWLRSREMDVEVRGDLTVTLDMLQEDLRFTGTLDVQRGTYTLTYPPLQSRRFQVRQGTIDFLGTPGLDPNLSITASYQARDAYGEPLNVLAIVGGTLQSPRVRLSSDAQQPISESDLASYLFFGVPTWQVANTSGATMDPRAFADLGLSVLAPSVLGYASSGLQTLVQNAGWLDYVALTAAEVAPHRSESIGIGNFLAGTRLELGRYLSSDLFFGYSQRLNTSSFSPGMRLQWQFLPEHSLELFAEDRLARTPGFGVRPEAGLRRVYGVLLFREWGF